MHACLNDGHEVQRPVELTVATPVQPISLGLAGRGGDRQFQAGVVGELMWTWTVKPAYVVPDGDPNYGISPGDPSLTVPGTP
jgi:hypothetical protein